LTGKKEMIMRRATATVLLVAAFLVVALGGCQLISVTGSGTLETLEMDLSGFSSVNISHAFQVTVTRSDVHFVSVTVDDNLVEYIDVRTSGSTLYIGMKPGSFIRTTQKATVRVPDLKNLTMSGASRADVSGFQSSESAKFGLSGASRLSLSGMECGDTQFSLSGASSATGDIKMGDAKLNLSGASDIDLEGSAQDVNLGASGASNARLSDLDAVNVKVSLSGASSAIVNASGTLSGGLSDASGLQYAGSPTLGKISVTGGSTLSKQ